MSLKGRKRSRRQPDCLNGNTGGGCEGRGGAHTSRRLDAGLKPSDLPGAVQQATARQGLALTHTSVCVYVCVGVDGGGGRHRGVGGGGGGGMGVPSVGMKG